MSQQPPGSSDQNEIFKKHPHSQHQQRWNLQLCKKKPGRLPVCAGCRQKTLAENSMQIVVEGLHVYNYTRGYTQFCVVRTYHFCASLDCISRKPLGSNLSTPPVVVTVSGEIGPGIVEQAIAAGIPIE